MRKSSRYPSKYFDYKVLGKLISELRSVSESELYIGTLSISKGETTWEYDDIEEFFEDYRREPETSCLSINGKTAKNESIHNVSLVVNFYNQDYRNYGTELKVSAPDKRTINRFFEILDEAAPSALSTIVDNPSNSRPVIFIGHGRSGAWRDLKDHLTDKHHYKVESYESGARAGHTIRDILDDMMSKSTFALLVLTAEDEMGDGTMRARQNVIHETGLFQGKLGFSRAIVLMENEAEEFSNIFGIQQLRFSKGNIREVFGDVLATLKREFPS